MLTLVTPSMTLTRGALAAGSTWTVNAATGTDPTDGTCPAGQTYKTLTYLFAHMCTVDGDTVNVAPGTYAGGFTISAAITLSGAGANATIISGGGTVVTVSAGTAAARVTISNVTITGANCCGGVVNNGTLTLDHSRVSKNTGNTQGGGIINQGTLTVQYSTIEHNTAGRGAGISNGGSCCSPSGNLTVISSTIDDNGASTDGGGIYNNNYYSNAQVAMFNSTLSGNTADRGGAIFNAACGNSVALTSSTVAANVGLRFGGGIFTDPYNCGTPANPVVSTVTTTSTILAGNTLFGVGPIAGPNCYGPVTSGDYNLLGNNSGCTFTSGGHDLVGTVAAPLNPRLAALDAYGGATATMGLLSGSPAIHAGSPTACSSAAVGSVDQRGSTRGTPCDIGAYDTASDAHTPTPHTPSTWFVNTSGSDATTCAANSAAAPFKTIGAALNCAADGDTVSLAASATPYDTGGSLTITKNVHLMGAGAGSTSIVGVNQILHVAGSYTVTISDLTVTHQGNVQGQDLANDGVLTLDHAVLTRGFIGGGGGAINSYVMTVRNSTITGNSAATGGGLYNIGSLVVDSSTISNNTASSSGGGIENYGSVRPWSSVLLVNSTVTGNVASNSGSSGAGGGLYNVCGQMMRVVNSTISGNRADAGGGLAFPGGCATNPAGQATLSNTILAANAATTNPDCSNASPSVVSDGTGHNILGDGTACTAIVNGANGDIVGTAGSPVDPHLAQLGSYGGPTDTMALLTLSPAIGAGDGATCQMVASDVVPAGIGNEDQRGSGRLANTRGACDIGAHDTGGSAPIVTPTQTSTSSTQQYTLTNSDGSSWQDMDSSNLALTLTPPAASGAQQPVLLSGNADLWTSSAGYNQDIGIWVSGGTYGSGQVVAWKESGGFAGTFSPNAAFVQTVLQLQGGTTYQVKLVWKSNKADPGTIWAGAGPIGGNFSPTRLTAEILPATLAAAVSSTSSALQYTLTGSDGSTWQDIDPARLGTSVTPSASGQLVLSGNSDLWTSAAGYNQDIGIWVSGGTYGSGQVVAWKESGGFAGTYSPNAAFVHTVIPVSAGVTYQIKLQWKANKADPGTIWAGAGPIDGNFSPTRLTAQLLPDRSSESVSSASSTQQYTLQNSDGATWQTLDASKLTLSLTPTANVHAILSGNADLWTSSAGYNQDIGIWVAGGAYGSGQVVAWKESGGFAGTFSPNAAFVHTILSFQAGTSYTVKLVWKANKSDPGTIWAGAGPIGGNFSPTRLTAELLP